MASGSRDGGVVIGTCHPNSTRIQFMSGKIRINVNVTCIMDTQNGHEGM